ncbi:MBL fold metallo-hydrolase [Catellatospora methionotrophica]|uniref:MBL fold metallo-hydrolase n=1 Tax=Catellatospora methionotrophica TaxID=121620 RepID=UPI0033FC039D
MVEQQHAIAARPELVKLADGVLAYIQPDGGWCVSNAGVLFGHDGPVLIDATATVPRARRLREAIDVHTTDPVRTLVITHRHGDHHYGANEVAPDATVIAHRHARDQIIADGLNLTGIWKDVTWGDIRLRAPSVTFADRMTIHCGTRRAELIHPGPAHTTGDTLVWLPDERILFAGDIVFSGVTPLVMMGSVTGSLRTLQMLRDLDPRIVVGGHGPIAGPEAIDANEAYLRWVWQLAQQGKAEGLTPLKTAENTDLGAFAQLLDPERLVANLHRAYAELDGAAEGAELEPFAILADIIAYNGGAIPTCLA